MKRKTSLLATVFLLFMFSGCGAQVQTDAEYLSVIEADTVTVSLPELEHSTATEDPPLDLATYTDTIAYFRTCQDYEAYQWMMNLMAEDVDYVEFVNLNDLQTAYRRYDGDEIQEVIDLFQSNTCIEYDETVSWPGSFTQEFHIIMKDGTAHSVCSIQSDTTVIDGAAFKSDMNWISRRWPYTGDSPLPKDWEISLASRSYHVAEGEVSLLVTGEYDQQRAALDRQYDTSRMMGSYSRNYPIGRGTVTLSSTQATATGVTLDAYWTGTFRGGNLMVMPEFWLERWVDEPEIGEINYIAVDSPAIIAGYTPQNIAQNSVQWRVQWGDICGALEPGHYRIGMTFYEDMNGVAQNEEVCYAKFSVNS